MAVGREASQTANDINAVTGALANELENLMVRIGRLKTFMDATDLKAAPFNMTSGDETVIKSAVTDMDQLRQIHDGSADLAVAKDFRTFVKQLVGIPTG